MSNFNMDSEIPIKASLSLQELPLGDNINLYSDSQLNATTSIAQGEKGEPGISPTIKISEIEHGHKITIVDVNGEKDFNVLNGNNDYTESEKQKVSKIPEMSKSIFELQAASHIHINEDILNGITSVNVEKWNTSQPNILETIKINGVPASINAFKEVDIKVPSGSLAFKNTISDSDISNNAQISVAKINGLSEVVDEFNILNGDRNIVGSVKYQLSEVKSTLSTEISSLNGRLKNMENSLSWKTI